MQTKAKYFGSIILFLTFSKVLYAQIHIIDVHSPYVEYFENGDVELREKLPNGTYYVIEKFLSENCVFVDTLMIGNIKDGLRNGRWINYTARSYEFFPCFSENEFYHIRDYSLGFLVYSKSNFGCEFESWYHNGQRILTKSKYQKGNYMTDSFLIDGDRVIKQFRKDNSLSSKYECHHDTTRIQQFYPNGVVSDDYTFVYIIRDGKKEEVLNGQVRFWLNNGQLISSKNYLLGELVEK